VLCGSGGNAAGNCAVETEEGNQVQLVLFNLNADGSEITQLRQFVNVLDRVYQ
jgi:hypothetical protein